MNPTQKVIQRLKRYEYYSKGARKLRRRVEERDPIPITAAEVYDALVKSGGDVVLGIQFYQEVWFIRIPRLNGSMQVWKDGKFEIEDRDMLAGYLDCACAMTTICWEDVRKPRAYLGKEAEG